jgi:hypothetical protein
VRAVAKEEISHGDRKDHKDLAVSNLDRFDPDLRHRDPMVSASPHARSMTEGDPRRGKTRNFTQRSQRAQR